MKLPKHNPPTAMPKLRDKQFAEGIRRRWRSRWLRGSGLIFAVILAASTLGAPPPATADGITVSYLGGHELPTATLKPRVLEVGGNYVTIGEIWPNASVELASRRAFHAPASGAVGRISAASLASLAQSHGVEIFADQPMADLIVRRAPSGVDLQQIREAISRAVVEGYQPLLPGESVEVTAPQLPEDIQNYTSDGLVRVRLERLNQGRGSYRIALEPMHCKQSCRSLTLQGTSRVMMELPVLAGNVQPNQRIAAANLATTTVPRARTSVNTIVSADELIGKVAKRHLQPNRPLTQSDVKTAPLVETNDRVTVEYRKGSLVMSLHGVALEDGALSDLVRVRNVASLRVLHAKVTGAGKLTVGDLP